MTNFEGVGENPSEDPNISVSVIFGVVGGVVLLISIALVLCIVWTRKRKHSVRV